MKIKNLHLKQLLNTNTTQESIQIQHVRAQLTTTVVGYGTENGRIGFFFYDSNHYFFGIRNSSSIGTDYWILKNTWAAT
jgi:hypothetical protein